MFNCLVHTGAALRTELNGWILQCKHTLTSNNPDSNIVIRHTWNPHRCEPIYVAVWENRFQAFK